MMETSRLKATGMFSRQDGAGGVSAQAVAAAGRVRAALALAAAVLALALAFMLAPQSAWADSAFGGGLVLKAIPIR